MDNIVTLVDVKLEEVDAKMRIFRKIGRYVNGFKQNIEESHKAT